jgi:hypothetical protein
MLTGDVTIQHDHTCVVVIKPVTVEFSLNLYRLANDTTLDLYVHLQYYVLNML